MDGITLKVTEAWQGDLEKELIALLKTEINPALEKANESVAQAMRDALARHIAKDVYSAYDRKMYRRRGAAGGLLGQAESMESGAGGMISDSARAKIQYMPDGGHPDAGKWAKKRVKPVHSDDLIGRIEKHSPEYSFLPKNGTIPNRPFWQNFVNEMVDGGGIETAWVSAMKAVLPAGWKLDMSDGGVQRDGSDGEYG